MKPGNNLVEQNKSGHQVDLTNLVEGVIPLDVVLSIVV